MTRYIFSLAGDHPELAQDEVASLFSGIITLIDEGRLLLETQEDILEKVKCLGLTKFVCASIVLAMTNKPVVSLSSLCTMPARGMLTKEGQ